MTQYQIMKEKMKNTVTYYKKNPPRPSRETVPVRFNGEKVGNATIDNSGFVSMVLSSSELENAFNIGQVECLNLVPKNKEK